MAAELPLWRRAFDTIEAAVGRPLEQAVGDPRFMRALIVGLEISNAVDRMARSVSSQALHLVNIPAHSDVRRISRRLGAIENSLGELAAAIERLERAAGTSPRKTEDPKWRPQAKTTRSKPSARRSSGPPAGPPTA